MTLRKHKRSLTRISILRIDGLFPRNFSVCPVQTSAYQQTESKHITYLDGIRRGVSIPSLVSLTLRSSCIPQNGCFCSDTHGRVVYGSSRSTRRYAGYFFHEHFRPSMGWYGAKYSYHDCQCSGYSTTRLSLRTHR